MKTTATKLGQVKLYGDTYTAKQLQQLENYGKLIWYDNQEYTNLCKLIGLKPCKSLYSEAKDSDNDSFFSSKETIEDWKSKKQESNSEGDIYSTIPKSLQYEEALNDLLIWYTSDHDKKIKPAKQLKWLCKPIKKVYVIEQVNKTLIRKSNKCKKRFTNNPFIGDFLKRGARSPMENLTQKILEHHKKIKEYNIGLQELKLKYTKNHNTKDREQSKRIQEAMQKFIH